MYSVEDVTIIIPVYCPTQESVSWFADCLESAITQGCYVSLAVDASPNSVYRIVRELWSRKLDYYVIEEHVGVSAARNVATKHANTELIFPLDCDDTLRPGAIEELVSSYTGTPLYPDLSKFGEENIPHYQLLEFTCEHLYTKVGLASVGVLHKKEQWETVGGWNEQIDFYEDGEYNARLMSAYCGKRYPSPLLNYRIHSGQRTKLNKSRSAAQVNYILSKIQEYPNMACCGKNRKKNTSITGASLTSIRSAKMDVNSLPGTQGDRVLAVYLGGKGGGKHYYQGPVTKYNYKVKYGEYYYVDPKDAKFEGDKISRSLFVRIVREADKIQKATVVAEKKEPVVRSPRPQVEKAPILEEKKEERPLPDIINLKWQSEIRHMDFTSDEAQKLLKIEKSGKARVRVIQHLEKFIETG